MAHGDSDTDHRRRRSRDPEAHHRRHRKRRHSKHGTGEPTSAPEASSQGTGQRLSMGALAQLNEHNARGISQEPPKEPERRPKRDRLRRESYRVVDAEYDPPRRERRRRDNDYEQSGGENDRSRRERRRKEEYREEGGYESRERDWDQERDRRRRRRAANAESGDEVEDRPRERESRSRKKDRRVVSGAVAEEGRAIPGIRGGGARKHDSYDSYDSISNEKSAVVDYKPVWYRKKKRWIVAGVALGVLIIVIVVAVVVSKKNAAAAAGGRNRSGLQDVSQDSIPAAAKGTYLDPFTWYDTTDFNVTYTNETVGDLPVMGLFSDWDDAVAANDKVPALDEDWGDYAARPARGVNLGGWLSLEPFITPSLFAYDARLGIVDEASLCRHLGPKTAAATLEQHYATFVTEQTFADIRAAGLDHVRIPYSYWAVETYGDDPFVFRTSWRYLLRAIEWSRRHGLRVNLDLHALPGSQNGWNHSGRQGPVGWLNGTDGALNARRSLDVHDRLTRFFAQPRYRRVVAFYGLANEPRMVSLSADAVEAWTADAYDLARRNGLADAHVVFGDGFMGLANWQGKLAGRAGLVLDVHQYVIFNNDQIVFPHRDKVRYACAGWSEQTRLSMDPATGFGPTMFAEWSQADTDCARHLTNVGWGNRWTGTYASGNASTEALTPKCPARDASCSCAEANADPSAYSDEYRRFLKMFAEAQMVSFEKGWGWWYWTWDTEDAPQWSYKKGLAAGILPAKAYDKDFNCDSEVPDFAGLSETF
ncbi:glycoside hydrolase family 5 protein [Durotheca rogersii]|uniref:glycoside hydrolase family 5 protein n=1 Tax=Durotheca rogersii TaxID=419775 RepID=UPI00221E39D0|nr:glycoside hydrolase family 5 protein [Durotheca rogersii]KAI5865952.1 glycoside hydrolase family 5 protein [Durotheca rogersii]